MRETIGSGATAQVLDFIYDANGKPFALQYKDGTYAPTIYYYVLNLQGDVVGLTDADGVFIVKYSYNSWGEPIAVTDADDVAITDVNNIAHINPLRYRGYYYDTETGFYYLQSRYYDPTMHRFINADSLASTGQGVTGTNMFAYCGNNPIRRTDPSGQGWLDWVEDVVEDVVDWTVEAAEDAWDETCDIAVASWDAACDAWDTVTDLAVEAYEYVTNTDEQVVLDAEYVAFYKGTLVIKAPIGTNAFSYGVIVLGDEVHLRSDAIITVKHEYGHILQLQELGVVNFTVKIAIPSIVGNLIDRMDLLPCNYYDLPWEYVADRYGDVDRGEYSPWADRVAHLYY